MSSTVRHGAWPSPHGALDAARAGGEPRWQLEQWVTVDGERIWWTEPRPGEGGRSPLVRWTPDAGATEVLGREWNVRNRIHEMGARPFTVLPDDAGFVFTHWQDQRMYRVDPGAGPVPITPVPARSLGLRYGDAIAVGPDVWCVRETVTGRNPGDVLREIVAIPLSGAAVEEPAAVRVLARTHRFMTGPRLSPDGGQVAWLGWDHPKMPWDATRLCVAPRQGDTLGAHRVIAGGEREALCQFWWSGNDELTVLTDASGWWNPCRLTVDGARTPLWTGEQEIGGALWKPGSSWAAPLADGRIALLAVGWYDGPGTAHGGRLFVLDPATGDMSEVDAPGITAWHGLSADGTVIAAVGGGPRRQPAVIRVDVEAGRLSPLTGPRYPQPAEEWLSEPAHRRFRTETGADVHAIVHLPRNPLVSAPDAELPPLLVTVHGGPTGRSIDVLDPEITFFTTRGFAVVAVNHGGSTGHGRAYRERLRGQWGVLDVAECALVARKLAEEGLVDGNRLLIRGGSAGGWTTCSSLTTTDIYRGGAAYYPVLDPLAWATGETHDLESHYLYGLIGPLPHARQRYLDRSPINNADRLSAPLLLLEGEEDNICPPAPCERMIKSIAGSGIPHAYLTFPGEGHVFRRAESIQRALEAELSFYGQVLGFDPVQVPVLPLTGSTPGTELA